MNKLLLIVAMGLGMFGCSTDVDEYKYEKEMVQCVKDEFNFISIDIEKEFHSYEKYLIETNILQDSSGNSYINFYKKIINENDLKLACEYKMDSSIINNYQLLKKCYQSHRRDKSIEYKKSKAHKLQIAIDSLMNSEVNNALSVAQMVISVLDSTDFEIEFYKIFMLQSTYLIEEADTKIKIRGALPNISIEIRKGVPILLNNKEVGIEILRDELKTAINNFSKKDKEIYIIKLDVEGRTPMSIVTSVKEILLDEDALRIHYRKIENRTD